jgi:dipeptidyl aminopeptidase/acylaminoacyl peptidase/uncharacterized protein (DUF885 family)
MLYRRLLLGIPIFWLVAVAAPAPGQGTPADYERSRNLSALTRNKVFKDRVQPHWLADNDRFWYRNDLGGGSREYILVDAVKGERKPAFDPARLAAALTKATSKEHNGAQLSIDDLDFPKGEEGFRFRIGEKRWKCDTKTYTLVEDTTPATTVPAQKREDNAPPRRRPGRPPRLSSPDGKWTVFVKEHNLYLRQREGGKEIVLSRDGKADDSYSERVFWSPDSKKLVGLRTKKGQEHKVYLIESSPRDQLQPKLHSMDYLKPGDRIAVTKPHLFDVPERKEISVKDELFSNPWSVQDVRWAPDSRRFTFVYNQRSHQVLRVVAVDAQTGVARPIIDEQSKTFIYYNQDQNSKFFAHYLDETNEIIWMSERDGWNHLYLYDAETGQVKNQITKGRWVVRGVDLVDEKARQVWFRAGGIHPEQDPYYFHYCRINFDGSNLVLLTDGDGTHTIAYSPDRRFLIDTYSRVDMAPVTELRNVRDGKRVRELERGDMRGLLETGWKVPERFVAKGRDGQTDIYGVIFRPTNFDANKKYPVVEQIYAGPQGSFVPKNFRSFYAHQALAELGFIVVQIDGMGTNNRSKAFHDVCYKNLGDAGFPDRILWLKAAAAKYPYMDLSRVGIFGGSAGGQNALGGVLFHPDFYKVAVANCGCHDNRMDKIWWNELWMGWPIGPHYAEQSNVTNAHKLRGKLLLIVGELDRNVDPASTMQVVNALIKAGKDFDLLVVPGAGHGARPPENGGYVSRRQQDFLVRHLLGVAPPDRNTPTPPKTAKTSGTEIKLTVFKEKVQSVPGLDELELDASRSELRPVIERYSADRASLSRTHTIPVSPARRSKFRQFYSDWLERLGRLSFDGLSQDGRVDYLLLKNQLEYELRRLDIQAKEAAEMGPLMPFASPIIGLEESRRRMEPIDPAKAANLLNEVAKQIDKTRKTNTKPANKTVALRAAAAVNSLRTALRNWFGFYNGYNPQFSWWVGEPYKQVDQALNAYASSLRDRGEDDKASDGRSIAGERIGRDALRSELAHEMIPYTPEELLAIAEKEMAWCQTEMVRASRELGFGDDWRKALEHVKERHVEPGKQPELIRNLAVEAIDFLDKHDLVTVPQLARDSWRMEMMSPERQLVNPFFTGGEVISVSFPTATMAHEAKLMSMRGNNIHFSRATVHHELIPGHHLQSFMTARHRTYRRPFDTAFWTEGWAVYWEMLLWDMGFPKSPEDRIGFLFWRMHRCARITFTLSFHLGKMSPPECVAFLIQRVGHEPANAAAEVRRSFQGLYGPLYQCAYLLGALQLRQLHKELVDSGKMTNRAFHDAVLKENRIPIEFVRASLTRQQLGRDYVSSWKFYGEVSEARGPQKSAAGASKPHDVPISQEKR